VKHGTVAGGTVTLAQPLCGARPVMQRSHLLLLLSVALAGLSLLCDGPDADERLQREADRLQAAIIDKSRLLTSRMEAWSRAAESDGVATTRSTFAARMDGERDRDGLAFWAWDTDTLALWTSELAVQEDSLLNCTSAQFRTANGIALHATLGQNPKWHALMEVWSTPPVHNRYLSAGFHPSLRVTQGISAATTAGIGPVVRDADGNVLFRLTWDTELLPFNGWDILKLMLRIGASLLLLAACWETCMGLARRSLSWTAVLLFAILLIALRYLSMQIYPITPFDRLPLFGPQLYATSRLLPSLGDLFITGILMVVLARFAHVALRGVSALPGRASAVAGSVATAALLLMAWWITTLVIGLVEDSSVDLDLHHLERLNVYSVIALASIALLFTTWLLLADAAARALAVSAQPRHVFVITLVAALLSLSLHHRAGIVDMILVLWPIPLLIIVIIGRRRKYHFAHAITGIAVLSLLNSHLLIKYAQNREHNERELLAERMVTNDDPVVELLFRETAPRLRADSGVYALLSDTLPCSPNELETRVRQEFFSGYWERYAIRLYAFDPEGNLRCATSSEPPRSLEREGSAFTTSFAVADMPDLFIRTAPGQSTFYHAQVAVMVADTSPPGQLVIELHPRIASEGQGYPELLLNDARNNATSRVAYSSARYEQGVLMEARGAEFPRTWSAPLASDDMLWRERNGNSELAFGSVDGSLVVLALPLPSLMVKATTFSWLFAFLSALLACAFLLRPLSYCSAFPALSIGAKVRVALLVFAAVGLFFFSFGAQRLLTGLYTERNDEALLEKTRSVVVELQHKLEGETSISTERAAYLNRLLSKFSNVFFTDINLYTPNGELHSTSRPQVFDAGLVGTRMHPGAFDRLVRDGQSAFVHVERIGAAQFRSAYLPLRDTNGALLAFVNLPSFARQGELEQERSTLFTAIVNLFVLLLALSLLAGVLISNWTTRPLAVLRKRIAGMALQGANEPIQYNGRDEIGELVSVYNKKVEELRESADRLARSERESAWKEMARQVAHEIKNPLTPMKLGIQHFQRSWDASAPDARQKLDRFSASMVEQIDALSRVANDFSQFAQMSAAHETVLDLNDVAKNAVELFQGDPNSNIVLHASAPLMVKADREHLLRVFNNLIKNALQAIPEGRRGRIEVRLHTDGDNVIAEVRDNGTGIPEEAQDRIFTPSFTTKTHGMGLGLAMAKRMVEQAHGTVSFSTQVGVGTTFIVTLPLGK
jgi:two-component system, NtrC family, nitrogen regulation sensor histidine kinase NtrY